MRNFDYITTDLDLAVGFTLQSQTSSNMSFFRVFIFLTPFGFFFSRKTSDVKKIPDSISELQYYFHINIFRHHREIAFVKHQIKTDTWQVVDSGV